MAKFRTKKPGEQRDQGLLESDPTPCAVVRHEKLCLKIDVLSHRLHGYAELKIVAPTKGVVGLHAQGLNILRVLCDGVPTEYEVLEASLGAKNSSDSAELVPTSSTEAADMACRKYLNNLERELAPELLIFVPESCIASAVNHDGTHNVSREESHGVSENIAMDANKGGAPNLLEERVTLVHVEYWLDKPLSGGHFLENIFHTSSQLHRARCWFPCVDLDFHRCSYEMEFTVDSKYRAVSCGKFLYKVESGSHLVTYVYNLDIPVSARYISLVVAPLKLQPDQQNSSISHFCIPEKLPLLQCTISFFSSVFSFYEDYLGASFPFGSYSHVFIDSELMVTSCSVGAAMTIINSHLMVDERIIDQTMTTRIKLAKALAQQWFGVYIFPESPSDGWLVEGLSMFLTDVFIRRHFGNNEAFYRRYLANEAVCKADTDSIPPLSSSTLHGTQGYGFGGQIYSWKSVAVVQMLEKQMGPDAFRKILQKIISRAQGPDRKIRSLSTKEFRHFANRVGNLERPFLKEFFLRWVEFQGCPVLRMGFEYNRRRNMIELAVLRSSMTAAQMAEPRRNDESAERARASDAGWPGMMSICVHEIDGMYDHPSLPMSGDTYQLLDIHCHSKLAGRRIQRPKKGMKSDGVEDLDHYAAADSRQSNESPLLWLRADPQMEYLADIQLQQPEQMWINQLEKDKDVAAQLQAIAAISSLPHKTFSVMNALNSCLVDSKVFFRVRIEAAFALAMIVEEVNGFTGLSRLLAFYKGHKFDPDMGLPKPNDFRDLQEYFVLQAIPVAISNVRGADGKSPPEAVEFILQILKHNDNSGNQYSDVFWLSSIIKSVGSLEFGHQSIQTLSQILKRLDRVLHYDRIMPSYNHMLTRSCIQTLTKLALKFPVVLSLGQIERIFLSLRNCKSTHWRVRADILRAMIDLDIHIHGLDSGINLALQLAASEPSSRVRTKVFAKLVHDVTLLDEIESSVKQTTFSRLISFLQSREVFENVLVRHHLFCMLQILAGRSATLFRTGMPEDSREQALKRVAAVDQHPAEEPKLAVSAVLPAQETAADQTQVSTRHLQDVPTEQIRIRLVSSGVQPAKEAVQAMSATSSGRQESEKRVRVLKLKLKSTVSATQENTREEPRLDGQAGAVQSSSMSVDMGVKKELQGNDSPHSIVCANVPIKQESDESERIGMHKEPASHDRSSGRNGEVRKRQKSISLNDALRDLGGKESHLDRDTSAMEASISERHPDMFGGLEHFPQAWSPDSVGHRLLPHAEKDEFLRFQETEADDGLSERQKTKVADEDKRGGKKRERDNHKHKHGVSVDTHYDKHNDPEYRERKRLKKERKRQQKLLAEQQQNQCEVQQHPSPKAIEEGVAPTQTPAVTGIKILQPRPPTGTSETVVRLKIKRL
ncbi:hypothetical protein KP509_22G030300 [Ceratopteris richardii]|uniref:Transcription initiation factor TFIID subunit 2 n=1 Tax=Ceratopteris richardii TaxID=49495 RepID=A0A8T2S3Q1_CERRI|nr:hypothetical protein KP509_22G030300 [Ceratopteris richardii]